MKARAHRHARRGGTRSGPQASPAARALYLSLALRPFPSCITGSEEAEVGGTCGEFQEIAPVDHPVVRHVRFMCPLRCTPKVPSSRKGVSSIRTPEVRIGRSDLSRPQHMLSLALKLPDPLLRYPQLLRQLREGRSLFLLEAVPLDQHVPMALR